MATTGGILGMDVDSMDRMPAVFMNVAEQFETLVIQAYNQFNAVRWEGPDKGKYDTEWQNQQKAMKSFVDTTINNLISALSRNISEQRTASGS